jgi:hypothetical protein
MKPPRAEAKDLGLTLLSSAVGLGELEHGEMEVTEKDVKFLVILGVFAALGFAIVTGTHFLPDYAILRRSLALALGEALIVASILGLTVDRYLKGYLIRTASLDVYKYLVGYNLPEEIKERLQSLMGTVFIRRNWQIAYTLTPIESDSDEVIIDVRYRFELENISNTVQTYRQRIQAEKYLNPIVLEMRCDDPESSFCCSATLGGSLGRDQEGVPGLIEASSPEIKIKPSRRNGELRYPFSAHYQLRTPSNHGDTFSFLHPSIGVTITAAYPEGYRISIEPESDTVITENMWQFRKRAFLQSEHVMVRWFKTSTGSG